MYPALFVCILPLLEMEDQVFKNIKVRKKIRADKRVRPYLSIDQIS